MNYGKKKASQKQKKITSKSAMQGKRVGVRLFKAFLLCLVVVAVIGVIGGGIFVKKIIADTPDVSPSDVKPKGFTTFVYADDGSTEIERFVSSGSNRVYKSIDEIPKDLQHAFVAIEDERFYDHNGIDLQGIARAAVVGITSGDFSEGASTITQQLIKNNVFPNFTKEKTFYDRLQRKLQEQYLALQIEKQMDKDEILESYMNTINLGQNSLGVQAAAKRYFNKDVSELTLSECAVIAGITQNPTEYNPITNPEDNQKRRNKVLKNMLEQGYIKQAQYDEAMADDVYARIQTVNSTAGEESPYSYFVDALAEQVMKDLREQLGYTETQAYNAVYSGGLSIYSTQNMGIQQICDEEMNDDANYPGLKEYGLDYALTVTRADGSVENYSSGHIKQYVKNTYGKEQGLLYSSEEEARAMVEEWKTTIAQEGDAYDEVINITPQPQAAVTIIDQSTGQIKAMVGGRGAKSTSLGLNRAYGTGKTGSKRQPGSCFKILASYAPALDACGKTLATVIEDEPYTLKGGQVLRNADGNYRGPVTIRNAIAKSVNVCAVKLSDEITQELGFEYCEKFGISTLVKSKEINGGIYSDLSQTLALGGITDGVYNYEMCAAYATIANGGVYNTPTLYTKILDHDGNVLLEGTGEKRTVLKAKRQPGSCFKILASYAPALDACGKTLATVIEDEPYTLKGGQVLRNADGNYRGPVTIRNAIAKSVNVCAVKLSDEITQELGFEYCEKFGISTLVKSKEINGGIYSDLSQTLALGGITDGVYNYEMCAAYATIANGGVYNTPTLYTKILDHDGNVLLEGTGEKRTVLKDSTAALLTSAMQTVVESGTGTACQLPNMPVAGKTGTTTSNKDLWFCGFTPYYTCAVWGGYDDNKECNYDTNFRFRLWKGIMSRVHENLEPKEFAMPSSVEQKTVCSITGKLAVAGNCPAITEYFATDTAPTESCPGHGSTGGNTDDEKTDDPDSGTTTPTTPTDPNSGGTTPPNGGGGGGNTPTPTPPDGGGGGGDTPTPTPPDGGGGGGEGGTTQ